MGDTGDQSPQGDHLVGLNKLLPLPLLLLFGPLLLRHVPHEEEVRGVSLVGDGACAQLGVHGLLVEGDKLDLCHLGEVPGPETLEDLETIVRGDNGEKPDTSNRLLRTLEDLTDLPVGEDDDAALDYEDPVVGHLDDVPVLLLALPEGLFHLQALPDLVFQLQVGVGQLPGPLLDHPVKVVPVLLELLLELDSLGDVPEKTENGDPLPVLQEEEPHLHEEFPSAYGEELEDGHLVLTDQGLLHEGAVDGRILKTEPLLDETVEYLLLLHPDEPTEDLVGFTQHSRRPIHLHGMDEDAVVAAVEEDLELPLARLGLPLGLFQPKDVDVPHHEEDQEEGENAHQEDDVPGFDRRPQEFALVDVGADDPTRLLELPVAHVLDDTGEGVALKTVLLVHKPPDEGVKREVLEVQILVGVGDIPVLLVGDAHIAGLADLDGEDEGIVEKVPVQGAPDDPQEFSLPVEDPAGNDQDGLSRGGGLLNVRVQCQIEFVLYQGLPGRSLLKIHRNIAGRPGIEDHPAFQVGQKEDLVLQVGLKDSAEVLPHSPLLLLEVLHHHVALRQETDLLLLLPNPAVRGLGDAVGDGGQIDLGHLPGRPHVQGRVEKGETEDEEKPGQRPHDQITDLKSRRLPSHGLSFDYRGRERRKQGKNAESVKRCRE